MLISLWVSGSAYRTFCTSSSSVRSINGPSSLQQKVNFLACHSDLIEEVNAIVLPPFDFESLKAMASQFIGLCNESLSMLVTRLQEVMQ